MHNRSCYAPGCSRAFAFASAILCVQLNHYHIERQPAFFAFYTQLMILCTRVYYIECILKVTGLGFDGYLASGWNRFELMLVFVALLDEFAQEMVEAYLPVPPMLLRVLRIARILRIIRLLKGFEGLRNVIMTTFLSFPSFVNITLLFALVVFMYAVLGVQLFYAVRPGEALHPPSDFSSTPAGRQASSFSLTLASSVPSFLSKDERSSPAKRRSRQRHPRAAPVPHERRLERLHARRAQPT